MIRTFLFSLGFVLGFTLEVRVEAAERVQLRAIEIEKERHDRFSSAVLEEPARCLNETGECAIRVGHGRKLSIESSKGRNWTISESTIVIRQSESQIRLVEGVLRVEGAERTLVEFMTDTQVEAAGDVFIERRKTSVTVVNVGTKKVRFFSKGVPNGELPPGLEMNFDRPDVRTGTVSVGLPVPFSLDPQVVRESKLYSGSKTDFTSRIEKLISVRDQAAQFAADLHREAVYRKIASIEADRVEKQKFQRVREARDRELREMFRRKVLLAE